MSDEQAVAFSRGLPETVLEAAPPEWLAELASALDEPLAERRAAVSRVAGAHPRFIDAWARLAELARDDVEAYAAARVGYHRGLDALRAAGWHGSGYVRWRDEENRGFLRALDGLRRAAGALGESDEEERCLLFARQLDPEWDRTGGR